MKFRTIPNELRKRLWKHQQESVDFAVKHLNAYETPCLVRMPTGTGKTGIIACLTKISNRETSLVLTPWAHLRNQMITDLTTKFWEIIKVSPNDVPVDVMLPSKASTVLNLGKPQVIVATFATLNDLRLNHVDIYERLAKTISLVIVDEGHYEPAVEWGKSVKGLRTQTVLLTATPYRNDLKLFRIANSKRSTHHVTHQRAVSDKIIRKLAFRRLDCSPDIETLAATFAKAWKSAKKDHLLPSKSPRAIVCCFKGEDVETTVSLLRKQRLKAIGVHEQFKDEPTRGLLKNVPDPDKSDAEIWVHQHKLTEGLDDHRFCCLALFTRIRNDRKLIQQVGRVLRRHNTDRTSPALLLAPKEYSAEKEWNAYLDFEPNLKLLEPQHFRSTVDALLDSQPPVEYFDGRFRRRFQPGTLSEEPQVIIPPSVLVRNARKNFRLDDYVEDCTDTLNTEDAVILGPDINGPCRTSDSFALWVYASVRNSRFLQSTSLYEIKLETHCVVAVGGFVFITDSLGNLPFEYLEEHTTNVPADQLARYLNKEFRPTHVSVNSAIPYDTVLRGADLRGHNLLGIPASLTDRIHICRSAKGVSKKYGRRYVGISKGRLRKEVSEEDRRTFELEIFVSWAQDVATILNSKDRQNALFQRYMPICKPPRDPIPKTICLDLLRLDVALKTADGSACEMTSTSSDVKETIKERGNDYVCTFGLVGQDGSRFSASLRIEYKSEKRRFWFNKAGGASVHVGVLNDDETSDKSLVEFLNQRQDIVLIGLDDGETVYQGRNFYKVDYSYAEQVLLDLIEQPKNAPKCLTEKGDEKQLESLKRCKGKKFPNGSLFKAIADRHINLPFDDEVLICDDLGTECADFVAADFRKRQLALIHAKTGSGSKISASAFHEVIAQAMKNLVYLTRNTEIPKGVTNWTSNAKWNQTGVPRLIRAPRGAPHGKDLWDKIKSEIIESSNPELYVVLVTSGCCDLNELKYAVAEPKKRSPEIAQLFHLLDGLNGYARQLGVRVIICDLPC